MLFGAHVSIAGGIENAPTNAAKISCEVFQMFSRSPHGGSKPIYTAEQIQKFKKNLKKHRLIDFYIHAPYYINLASSNNRIRYGSISAIRDELEIGSKLGAKFVMTHLGSAKDFGQRKSMALVIDAVKKILNGYTGSTELLLENSAGAGQIIGDRFEELGQILKKIKNIGVCLDTCHAFASGYDFRTKNALEKTLAEFDKKIGLKHLKLFHFNDSLADIATNKDRHADIGTGFLGEQSFSFIINHAKLRHLNAIIETPALKMSDNKSLLLLKALREK